MDEAALRKALGGGDDQAVQRLDKLVGNIVEHPENEKFRSLKMKNKAIEALLAIAGVETFLRSVGFDEDAATPGVLAMPVPTPQDLAALARELERIRCELAARRSGYRAPAWPKAAFAPASTPTDLAPPSSRLVIFDFDGTITIDSHVSDFGLAGERLVRLQEMADRLLAAGACTALVTAQRNLTTRIHTVPLLCRSGLARLFCAADLVPEEGSEHMHYRSNPEQGAIYTGQEAWNKVPLISKIMAGENRWRLAFAPSQVMHVDDRAEQLRGKEALGIAVHHVRQDGMSEDDMLAVEAFACPG